MKLILGITLVVMAWLLTSTVMAQVVTNESTSTVTEAMQVADPDEVVPCMVPPIEFSEPLIVPAELLQWTEQGKLDIGYVYQLILLVNDIARKKHVSVEIAWRVIKAEASYCHFDSKGRVKRGGSGEWGICQILADKMKLKKGYKLAELDQNLECGFGLLSYATNDCGYDEVEALSWYNSGSPNTRKGRRYARKVLGPDLKWVELDRDKVEARLEEKAMVVASVK